MIRLLLYWAYHSRRQLLGLGSLAFLAALFTFAHDLPAYSWLVIALGVLLLAVRRWERVFWSFGKRRWQVAHASSGRVSVYHEPKRCDRSLLDTLIPWAEETLNKLEQQFGFTLQRRLVIFLFPTHLELSRIFQFELGAGALPPADAIVLAADTLYSATHVQETLRHECAHLFSGYWGELEPAFKSEGLATWLQQTWDGKPIEFHALALIKGSKLVPLPMLWSNPDFYSDRQYNYTLAGSFTGFLLRTFGWEAYRLFFQQAFSVSTFRSAFEKAFGVSFHAASRQWLQQLLEREREFMPGLETAVREARIVAACNSWQLLRALEEFEELEQHRQVSAQTIWWVMGACFLLGRYEQAGKLCQRILESDDERFRACRGLVFLHLGEVHDLQGQREKALDCYQRTLASADWADWWWQTSAHEEAKRYLDKPLTEQAWWRRYNRATRSTGNRRS